MDDFVFRANINKFKSLNAIKYVNYTSSKSSLCEYVFFEHNGYVFSCFLSSMILYHDSPVSEQIVFIQEALLNNIFSLNHYFFNNGTIILPRKDVVDFISTKLLMDLNLVKELDKKHNLSYYDFKIISTRLNDLLDNGVSNFEAYKIILLEYNYSTINLLGREFSPSVNQL